jgi:hypothetical protein
VHFFGYKRVKYLDDGRDYVSFKEFLSIHVTFSVLNSWMTYFVIFNFFQFIKIWEDINYVNKQLEVFGIIAMVVMMFETVVYLAYYKDVIFALITLLNYIGMYIHNFEDISSERDPNNELPEVLHCQVTLIALTSVFIIVTILHDFDKVFYLQYSKFYGKFRALEDSKKLGALDTKAAASGGDSKGAQQQRS